MPGAGGGQKGPLQPQGAATPRCHDAGLGCCLPACTAACPSPLAVTVQAATSLDGFGSKAAQLEKSLRRWSDPLTLFFLKMHEMQAAAYGDSHTHAHAHTPAQGGGGGGKQVFWHCTHAPGVRQQRWGSPGLHAAHAAQISGYRQRGGGGGSALPFLVLFDALRVPSPGEGLHARGTGRFPGRRSGTVQVFC